MRLLAECVYAAKFIAEGQAKRLVDVIFDFLSEKQADRIKHHAFLTDRVKTDNRSVMNNIAAINDAMSRHLDGEEVFKQIDLKTYTKRVFSMYGGEQRLVEIRFINPLLDAVVTVSVQRMSSMPK